MPRWPEKKYDKNRHSCYLLKYHLIIVTKYRHPVLAGVVADDLKELVRGVMEKWDCRVIAVNTDMDHVHILFSAKPQTTPSVLVNNIKTVTSRELRKRHADFLKSYYWKPFFWSDSYYIGCVSDTTEDIVSMYISSQGSKRKE